MVKLFHAWKPYTAQKMEGGEWDSLRKKQEN